METKICSKCKKKLSLDKFGKNRSRKDGLQGYCKECDKKRFKEYYRDNKEKYKNRSRKVVEELREWFVDYKKTLSCENCGDDRWYVLTFHHDDPNEKEFTIANMITSQYSKKRILKEIEKCSVLCFNCHTEKHYLEKIQDGIPSA